MAYVPVIKGLHIACVLMSGVLFVIRGLAMMADAQWRRRRFWLIAPHVVDSFLLASAIGLSVLLHQYPLQEGWLTAKLLGLIVYILLGTIAIKRGRTRAIRSSAFFAACLVFAYIVSVALRHDAAGFLF